MTYLRGWGVKHHLRSIFHGCLSATKDTKTRHAQSGKEKITDKEKPIFTIPKSKEQATNLAMLETKAHFSSS